LEFWRSFLPSEDRSVSGARAVGNVADHDRRIGLLGAGANLALSLALEGPSLAPRLRNGATQAAYRAWRGTVGRVLFPNLPAQLNLPKYEPAADPAPGGWRSLLKRAVGEEKITPKSLGDSAYGAAATGVALLESVRAFVENAEDGDPEPKEGSVATRLLDSLREALKKSAHERQARERGYCGDPPLRDLLPPHEISPAAPPL
jgi:hypothetical protein